MVKWKLFSDLDNTWEPEYHFSDKAMLEDFNQKSDGAQRRRYPLAQKGSDTTFPLKNNDIVR